ncbi:GntR family transcriptional regulator [Microbacterium rhizomatis]|uniref:GntR family transcriptional regulator n=1 Tax=Microbacterium rhizomatis TaxID=1631477 RepID=A0A5J5IZQ9_9MICO|nr:GntR family transcriptional regulator [Microbacterium rhizomatis]KAA9105878.1 GntR family transcriptional regulator [Microbacterium rhizomatis]
MSYGPTINVSPTTLTDAVYESLRQRIATGEIPSGDRVTEARVVGEYSVARPTAKACIERLVGTGLLQRSTHKSAVVTTLTVEDIDDLFLVRTTIERAAAVKLAQSGAVPRSMLEAQRAYDVAGQFDDRAALVRADIEFHASLVHASGSKRLARMHELIAGEILLTIGSTGHQVASRSAVTAEHAGILESLERGLPYEAGDRLASHLDAAHRRVRAAFLDSGEKTFS